MDYIPQPHQHPINEVKLLNQTLVDPHHSSADSSMVFAAEALKRLGVQKVISIFDEQTAITLSNLYSNKEVEAIAVGSTSIGWPLLFSKEIQLTLGGELVRIDPGTLLLPLIYEIDLNRFLRQLENQYILNGLLGNAGKNK